MVLGYSFRKISRAQPVNALNSCRTASTALPANSIARELEDSARKRDTARRVRECTQRAKAGRRKVWVEIGPDDEDTLMTAGGLGEWDFDDRKAISKAIERLLAVIRQGQCLTR